MDKEDPRKQSLEQLHEKRKQVMRLHNKGHKVMKIDEMTGFGYPTVPVRLICLNKVAGLPFVQRREQLKMDFCLWSRAAVIKLIYAPSGQTPVTYTPGGKREKRSMIATATN